MRRVLPHSLKHLVTRQANPQARKLVLGLVAKNGPITVQDLYQLTTKEQEQLASTSDVEVGADAPSIPSMRYLKKVVLPDLQNTGEVEKVHQKLVHSEEEIEKLRAAAQAKKGKRKSMPVSTHAESWKWQLKAPAPEVPAPVEEPVFGAEVGVGEDWSHLNKRRQRAREEKVASDVQWLKELEAARREA
ncbi:hypothetical protein C8Q80DRAFT_1054361, partial [Daedaleopsis nitida]